MPTTDTAEHLILQLSGIIAALVVIYNAVKWGWKALKGALKTFKNIQYISAELSPNGGKSVFDMISRIDKRQVFTEHRERAVLQESNTGMFELNKEGDCVWANKAFMTLTQRPFEDLKARGWENTISDEDIERITVEWNLARQAKRDFEGEYSIDREIDFVNVRCRATVVKNSAGEVLGWFGIVKIVE